MPTFLVAQNDFDISNLNLNEGLSYRLVLDIEQDDRGFMWFATFHGLNRYDGTECQIFKYDSESPVAFSRDNRYTCLEKDADGQMWLGAITGELTVFNPTTFEFQTFRYDPENPTGLQSKYLVNIYSFLPHHTSPRKSEKDILIIGSEQNGIDPSICKLERYLGNGQFKTLFDFPQRILHLTQTQNGDLWILSEDGWYFFDEKKANSLPQKKQNGGVLSPVSRNNKLTFPNLNANEPELKSVDLPDEIPPENWVHFVFDNQENLWLKSRDGRVFKCETKTGEINFFGNFPIYSDRIFRLYTSSHDLLWATESNGGVNKVVRQKSYFKTFLNASGNSDGVRKDDISFVSFAETKDGSVLCNNTGGSVFKISPGTENVERISMIGFENDFFKNEEKPLVKFIAGGEKDVFWLATQNLGLVKFDLKTNRFRKVAADRLSKRIGEILAGDSGNIWGTFDEGIFILNTQTEEIQIFDGKARKLNHPAFIKEKKVIFTPGETGFWKINTVTQEEAFVPLPVMENFGKKAIYAFVWHRDFLWIASFNGLIKYDLLSGKTQLFNKANGLPSDIIYSVIPEGKNLWLTTYNGLAKFNIETEEVKNYSSESGLPHPQFNAGAALKTRAGKIFAGGKNGIIAFHPKELAQIQPENSELILTKIEKFNGSKNSFESLPTDQPDSLKNIVLNYNDRSISFRFALMNFTDPSKNNYAFFLEGYEPDWNYAGNSPEITYRQLPPGKYVFRAKAADPSGNWSRNEFEISLQVKQAWFKTGWAISAYILGALSGIFLFYRFQLKRRLEQEEALRLKDLDKVKTKLYTNITHEFRTPLTVILGMAEQLDVDPKKVKKKANLITRNAGRLLNLVNQILDLSKLESGKLPVNLVREDVVSYFNYLLEGFHSFTNMRNVRLHFLSEIEFWEIDLDKEKYRNIIINLVSNSVKFTPDGGNIYVQLKREGNQLILNVKDTGIGIPPEKLPHIFDRFYQADDSYTRTGEGTGVGLALVKELTELMKGEISVSSQPGVGTEFIIKLPAEAVLITGADLPKAIEPEAKIIDPANVEFVKRVADLPINSLNSSFEETDERPQLLLIEDNRDVAEYVFSILKTDYQIRYEPDGAAGIEAALESIPDIIISDVMMPKKDGFEVVRILKNDERTSHIPIILLTAKASMQSKIEGLETGADAYVAKPFNQKELTVRLEKLLELRRLLQEKYAGLTNLENSEKTASDTSFNLSETENAFLQKLKNLIEENLNNPEFDMPKLSQKLAMSRSQVYRKIKAITGKSPSIFIRSFRLRQAKELLQTTDMTASEVAYEVGFSSLNYFSNAFLEEFGFRPSEARK